MMLDYLLVVCFMALRHQANGEFQNFTTVPHDTEVPLNRSAALHCHVIDLAGTVQWSKDAVMLGFDASLPGYPRYSMETNKDQGIYNLQIEQAQMEDEGDFECQVGPFDGQPPLKAKARLIVVLPPTSIRIVDHVNGSRINIQESESISLTCEVTGGKPAAAIRWIRNKRTMPKEESENSVEDEEQGRQTAKSKLNFRPRAGDNKANYTCEGLGRDNTTRLTYSVQLNVLYPPGEPRIEVFKPNEKIRAGDTVKLRCMAQGGNPLAQLTWKKDGEPKDHSYVTSSDQSTNELSIVAAPSDDEAVYSCESSNAVSPVPVNVSVTLSVLYPPSAIKISARKEAKSGDYFAVSCTAEKSNPAAEISWVVDGQHVTSQSSNEAQEKGGYNTISEIYINITQADRNLKLLTCYATNHELSNTTSKTENISILYAPDPPSIFGYLEGTAIKAGTIQRMTCVSYGGNPLPDLRWYKGSEELKSGLPQTTGNVKSVELTIVTSARDNGAKYQCKSNSKAMPEPLVVTITLIVYFSPSILSLNVKPKAPKAGSEVDLVCKSGSSNPPAKVSWWHSGNKLPEIVNATHSSSENGGATSKLVYPLNVTAEDNGSTYTCQATNDAMQQSIHDSIVLNVKYKPVFSGSTSFSFEAKEGESLIMNLTAKGNPGKITYQWKRDDEDKWDTSVVNISNVHRSDAGNYTCLASNEIGTSKAIVDIKVLFPATILKPELQTKVITVDPRSFPRLECRADGYPLPENVIKWERDSLDKLDTQVISKGGRSVLIVRNVTKEATGVFTCTANNGIGTPDTRTITLLVKHAPVMVEKEAHSSVISDRGVEAKLKCQAKGVPAIEFKWFLFGIQITDERLTNVNQPVDHITYEGILTISKVETKDFKDYTCIARNEMSFDTALVQLKPDCSPDHPLYLKVLNSTYTALYVTWFPGFDGGHNQTFRVRFKQREDPSLRYYDVHPPFSNSTWITNLKSNTEYEIAIMSFNVKGPSDYTEVVKAKTPVDPGQKLRPDVDDDSSLGSSLVRLLISTISTVFVLLLIFNIVLLAVYYRKKAPLRKKFDSGSGDFSSLSDVSSSHEESQETTLSTSSGTPAKNISSYSSSLEETSVFEDESSPTFTKNGSSELSIRSETESYEFGGPMGVFV